MAMCFPIQQGCGLPQSAETEQPPFHLVQQGLSLAHQQRQVLRTNWNLRSPNSWVRAGLANELVGMVQLGLDVLRACSPIFGLVGSKELEVILVCLLDHLLCDRHAGWGIDAKDLARLLLGHGDWLRLGEKRSCGPCTRAPLSMDLIGVHFVGVPKGLPYHRSHCDDSLLQDSEEERIESPDRRATEHFAVVAKNGVHGQQGNRAVGYQGSMRASVR
mmetsp:Transcript_28276/g.50874  ORF Transcript_28276/g.50874 Transcript_28276/m.50874 type:complete len:217 (-) Transcript_28276:36-686(-)